MVKPNMEFLIKLRSFISMARKRFWSEETLFASLAAFLFAFFPSALQFTEYFSKFSEAIISDLLSINLIFYVLILTPLSLFLEEFIRRMRPINENARYKFTAYILRIDQSLSIGVSVFLFLNSLLFYVFETFFDKNISESVFTLTKYSILFLLSWVLFLCLEWWIELSTTKDCIARKNKRFVAGSIFVSFLLIVVWARLMSR